MGKDAPLAQFHTFSRMELAMPTKESLTADLRNPEPPDGWHLIVALGIVAAVIMTTTIVTGSAAGLDAVLPLLLILGVPSSRLP
jgi:hypothetical protein